MHDPSFPEVGSIVHFEHVNFEVDDHDMATVFFMGGLGFTRDPYKRADETNMGVNVGMQQFHLPRRGNATSPFPGEIGLVVPDLTGIRNRLARLQSLGKFDDTPFQATDDGNTLQIISPFGIELRLHAFGTLSFLRPLGIAYLDIPVPPGTTGGIRAFYREIMQCPAEIEELAGDRAVVVPVGPYQHIHFRECERDTYDTHDFHAAVYVSGFNALRDLLISHDSLMGDALEQTFFFDRIFDPGSGETLFRFQHEVRGLYHPDFMRPLINRWPMAAEPFSDQAAVMAALQEHPGLATSR